MATKINDIITSYKGLPVTDYPPNLKKVVRVGCSEEVFWVGFFFESIKEERKWLCKCSAEYTCCV